MIPLLGTPDTTKPPSLIIPGSGVNCQIVFNGMSRRLVKQQEMFEDRGEIVYYWAENGLIKWEHMGVRGEHRKTHGAMTWQECAKRVLGLSEMAYHSRDPGHYADEKEKMQRFICDMETLLREAKDQGGPVERGVLELSREPTKVKLAPNYCADFDMELQDLLH